MTKLYVEGYTNDMDYMETWNDEYDVEGETIEECREALKDTLSQWLLAAYEDHNVPPKISDLAWLSLYAQKEQN